MPIRLGALAVRYGCELRGDPEVLVDRVAPLSHAGPGAVTFLANRAYRPELARTGASAVILTAEDAADCPVAALVAGDPYLLFARVAAELHPPPPVQPGTHASARLDPQALVPPSCEIGPGAVVGRGARLGERVRVGANSVVGADVSIGDDTVLHPAVVVYGGVRIGRRCLLHSGAVIGADGFGMARDASGAWVRIPQVGAVQIGDDVEIGANTTIDRGAIGDTRIGDGVKLDNQIQVGHNCVVGGHTAIAAQTGIAGSTRVGARCMIGGKVGIVGHISIADDVNIAAGTNVMSSIGQAGTYGGAIPCDDLGRWRRNAVRFGQLDALAKSLRRLAGGRAIADDTDAPSGRRR